MSASTHEVHVTDHTEVDHGHPADSTYWKVGAFLFVVTALEVSTYWWPSDWHRGAAVALIIMMIVKFSTVAAYFMHLKNDARVLRRLFVTGIIVAGLGTDGHGYVLEDLSGKYTPAQWAAATVSAYHRHRADRVVAETNQGGDMVAHTLKTLDPDIAYKAVHASRGKVTRAEPIAALDSEGRIHHAGFFPALEDEMCRFDPIRAAMTDATRPAARDEKPAKPKPRRSTQSY